MADRTLISQDQLRGDIPTSKLAEGDKFIKNDGSVAMEGDLDAGSNKIVNVDDPVDDGDAVNKGYLDGIITSPLPVFLNEEDAKTIGGLSVGQFFALAPGSDVGQPGQVMMVLTP